LRSEGGGVVGEDVHVVVQQSGLVDQAQAEGLRESVLREGGA